MDESKRFLGIAYLYTIITAVFSIASYLLILVYSGIDKYSVKAVLLDLLVFASIWLVLYIVNRKRDLSFGALFKDDTVRKSAGGVIIIDGLINIIYYPIQVVQVVYLTINGGLDASAAPTLVSFLIILCQILTGLFLLKSRNSAHERNNSGVAIGTAYLYALITVAFSLINNLLNIIINRAAFNNYSLLWLVCVAVMILVLYLLNRKQNKNIASVFHKDTARKSAGILIIITGIVYLSVLLNSVINIIWLLDINIYTGKNALTSMTLNAVKLVIAACQIGLGAYLLKAGRKTDGHINVQ